MDAKQEDTTNAAQVTISASNWQNQVNDISEGLYSTADQRLCFRYTDSTISLLLQLEISSF